MRVTGKLNPTNYGNVQPRLGLAYAFNDNKEVVRAGFGLFTGPWSYSDLMVGSKVVRLHPDEQSAGPAANGGSGVVGLVYPG